MIIAIIPARGGSKRIPRKNIREFCGQPMITYSIKAALETGLFDRVIVSTDDLEIAQVSNAFGAETPFLRPAELSDDYTGTAAVVRHTIKWMNKKNTPVDVVCCLYATVPFVQIKYLKQGYNFLINSGKKYAFSVTTFPFPIQRALKIRPDGSLVPFQPECIPMRSQDLEEAFHDAGQFYWGKAEAFLEDIPVFSSASVPVVLPRYLVQDVDTLEDWKRAEVMFRVLQEKGLCR